MPNKYHATRCDCQQGGVAHRHDSLAERSRCFVLHQRLAAGEIVELELQPRYPLEVEGVLVATYVGDFSYLEAPAHQRGNPLAQTDWREVVEDVKGVRTPVYRLKKKLMKACQRLDVQEVS